MKKTLFYLTAALGGVLFAAQPAATALVTVNLGEELGPIKPMNAVNNGPAVKKPGGDQVRGNFEDYKAARIPFARTHDSINCVSGGAHTCDINAIFRDFDADENDPRNYDFVFTDHYLDTSAAPARRCSSASARPSSTARRSTACCPPRTSPSGRASAST